MDTNTKQKLCSSKESTISSSQQLMSSFEETHQLTTNSEMLSNLCDTSSNSFRSSLLYNTNESSEANYVEKAMQNQPIDKLTREWTFQNDANSSSQTDAESSRVSGAINVKSSTASRAINVESSPSNQAVTVESSPVSRATNVSALSRLVTGNSASFNELENVMAVNNIVTRRPFVSTIAQRGGNLLRYICDSKSLIFILVLPI